MVEEQNGGGALAKMSATAAPMKPKKGADEGQNSAPRPMVECCFVVLWEGGAFRLRRRRMTRRGRVADFLPPSGSRRNFCGRNG